MRNILYIVGGILVLAAIAIGVWLLFFADTTTLTPSGAQNTGFPIASSTPGTTVTPSGSGVTVASPAGGNVVTTKNFLIDPMTVQDPVNPGYYYLGYHAKEDGVEDSTATEDPPYIILYIDADQSFTVELLHEPLGDTRKEAQDYLMTHLGITEREACVLQYSVRVPNSVNSFYAGQSLGFSFCPGATELP